jgi:hypothetical protein
MSVDIILPKYNLSHVFDIINTGFEYNLPDKTIDVISLLSEQVGAPSYVRTPIFNKKDNKRKKKNMEISDEDWDAIRNFQKTTLEKKEGIEKYIVSIRKCLNKLTDATYNTYSEEIIQIINELEKSKFSEKDQNRIGESIFNIASSNAFYSELYALLFKTLIHKYNFMKVIFTDNLNQYLELFNHIEYHDPEIDYEKFCDNNEINDKRKATSLFYVNLMKVGVLDDNKIIEIILSFQTKLNTYIDKEESINESEEISENIYILIKNSFDCLQIHDSWNKIHEQVEYITQLTNKSKSGISNKIIFKHMDLIDIINENN